MTRTTLLAQADAAFDEGRPVDGLALLRELNKHYSDDAASWHRQAIVEEQIGSPAQAGLAHYRCIEVAPNNALGYLYAGHWLQRQQQTNAAAALYSIAQDLDASILHLAHHQQISEQARLRSSEANLTLRHVLSKQHRDLCAKMIDAERIADAKWVQTNDQAIHFKSKNFAPELFYIPSLAATPFHECADCNWAQEITEKSSEIQQELTRALEQKLSQDSLRPYLSGAFAKHSDLSELANSANWLAMDLYKNGELNTQIAGLFPTTLKALQSAPHYTLDSQPFEIFFSLLKPGQQIAPHYGQSNHALTAHLALDIPPNCHLTVDTINREWKAGELILFDDSFLHSAHNNSDQTRVVLIFSIWHPDLSENEKTAIQQCFQARQDWLNQRQSQIKTLLALTD
ncbi:aspartyl/asparaginyl beta-hydroxylase domain-containing protein [Arenicella xantha]|uniref:Aspartyl/asparaginyl beta-hydroxylase n=1 Tax=Arenicella xantha TaxID=644221 RepID=A0A395JP62_9GAMM|nr:aspartyl/asparaginyl beta-hydroxylase domain-containing protein [Arenicella xantha]RBP53287.1 aspartyl/asparaginyl beta-hydroxylase [Arenicella xantha]